MAIVSYGYPGLVAPGRVWYLMQMGLGNRYYFAASTAGSGMVTASASAARAVDVAAGWIGGKGIIDNIGSIETVPLTAPPSGTEYFLIVARRTWQNVNATTIAAIDLGQTIPANGLSDVTAYNNDPGNIDDQALALVSLAYNGSAPVVVYDLRTIGTSKGIYVIHPNTPITWVDANQDGFEFWQNGVRYTHVSRWTAVDQAGSSTWATSAPSNLPDDALKPTDDYSTWPLGQLMFPNGMSLLRASVSTDNGWPITNTFVLNFKIGSWFRQLLIGASSMYFRNNATGAWQTIYGPGVPTAEATGEVSISAQAGTATPVPIQFPSGRFTATPRVTLGMRIADPTGRSCSFNSPTKDGCVILVSSPTAMTIPVQWQAVQGIG